MKMVLPLVLTAMVLSFRTSPASAVNPSPAAYDQAIKKYVRFLEKQKQTPVEYILNLFECYDLVVLCERFHGDVTQYDMIYELVSNPGFQQQAGHVFTEVGTATLRPIVESFLMDDQLSDEQASEKMRYIARNIGWLPAWENTNFYDFLRKLYNLNRSLPRDRRVHVYPSDLDFRWEDATKESWAEFENEQLRRRDKIMAVNIITKFNEISQVGNRKKALVIMNYRHAFPHLEREGGEKAANERADNTGGYLIKKYPGRLANVMINSVALLPGATDQRAVFTAIQEGKWDAAFAVLGNPNRGFDFKGSPLGEDSFDYFPFIRTGLRYQDVFTGFVFSKPLKAHWLSWGSEVFNQSSGSFDESFADEIFKRFRITGREVTKDQGKMIRNLGTVHISGYEEETKSDYAEKIQQWLKAKP
jgi:hypothetical protein